MSTLFPLSRYVLGTLVVVESLDSDVEEAFVVAAEYLDHVKRIGCDAKFVRAVWFVKSPYEPGILLRAGFPSTPRCFSKYRWKEHDIQPWYFGREL